LSLDQIQTKLTLRICEGQSIGNKAVQFNRINVDIFPRNFNNM